MMAISGTGTSVAEAGFKDICSGTWKSIALKFRYFVPEPNKSHPEIGSFLWNMVPEHTTTVALYCCWLASDFRPEIERSDPGKKIPIRPE